jgi:hypothetical protein
MNQLAPNLFFKKAKTNALRSVNQIRWRKFLTRRKITKAVILIIVPGLEHLSIPCARLLSPFFPVVLVGNGLTSQAGEWVSSALPHIPIFSLITSTKGAGTYILSHGEALVLLTQVPIDVIFVDPDCYVFEPALISALFRSIKSNAIASLHADPTRILGFSIPDTFCFLITHKPPRPSDPVRCKAYSNRPHWRSVRSSPPARSAC